MLENVIVALNNSGGPWGEGMWRACWQGGVAVLAVWLVCRLFRKVPAGAQCWLWRAAYVKLLVSLLWAGTVALPVLPGFSPVAALPRAVTTALAFLPASPPSPAGEATVLPEVTPATLEPDNALPASPAVEAPAAKVATLPSLAGALLLLWLLGVGRGARRLWRARGEARRILLSARPLEDAVAHEVLAGLCERFRLRAVPRLATGEVASPVLLGVWRPLIVLPARVQPDELPMMLAHELAHVQRRDLAWNGPAAVVETLFFFHPLLWPARREWRLAQEMACDALAVERAAAPRSAYGAMLVSVAASGRCAPDLLAAGISESYRTLARRLAAIGERAHLTRRRLIVLGASLLLLGALVLVPWRLASGKPGDPAGQSDALAWQPEILAELPVDKSLLSSVTGYTADDATVNQIKLSVDDPLTNFDYSILNRSIIHNISIKVNHTNYDTKETRLLQNKNINTIDVLYDTKSNTLCRITAYDSVKYPHGIPPSFDLLKSYGIKVINLKTGIPQSSFKQAIQATAAFKGAIAEAQSIDAYYVVTEFPKDTPQWLIIASGIPTTPGEFDMYLPPDAQSKTITHIYQVNAETGKLIGTTIKSPVKEQKSKVRENKENRSENKPLYGPVISRSVLGQVHTRWIAPSVRSSTDNVGIQPSTTVTWLSETGEVLREVSGGVLQTGFLVVVKDGQSVIYGLNGDWQLTVPAKPDMENYLTGTPDGRYFFHEQFKNDQVAIDAYKDGKLIAHIGPYPSRGGFDHPGDDGSLALLVWDSMAKKIPQVLVVGPDGKERFRVKCDLNTRRPVPGPNGTGALLTIYGKGGGGDGEYFAWYTAKGLRQSLDVGPNAVFSGWVPGSRKALIWTSIKENHYSLVDWDTGKILWDIPSPEGDKAHSIALTPDFALFAVTSPTGGENEIPDDGSELWIRSFYALSLRDGKPIAYRREKDPVRFNDREAGFFIQREQALYFVTNEKVMEISPDDILAKRNGWSAAPGKQ